MLIIMQTSSHPVHFFIVTFAETYILLFVSTSQTLNKIRSATLLFCIHSDALAKQVRAASVVFMAPSFSIFQYRSRVSSRKYL